MHSQHRRKSCHAMFENKQTSFSVLPIPDEIKLEYLDAGYRILQRNPPFCIYRRWPSTSTSILPLWLIVNPGRCMAVWAEHYIPTFRYYNVFHTIFKPNVIYFGIFVISLGNYNYSIILSADILLPISN